MKLYIVYFRTMENSPEVRIIAATTNKDKAEANYMQAKKWEEEWGDDEDSGDWAEARIDSFDMPEDRKPGDTIFVTVETEWLEAVVTTVTPFLYEVNAKSQVALRKAAYLDEFPGLTSDDEDHLEDPDVAVDVYFSIEAVVLE